MNEKDWATFGVARFNNVELCASASCDALTLHIASPLLDHVLNTIANGLMFCAI
jgi:hypothetical protein